MIDIACIIPARGGSKRIPRKNIAEFCGKPLIAWSIECAKASQYIKRVYVSSEDEEILKISTKYGAIAIKRPQELAMDLTSTEDTLVHALNHMDSPDVVVFLQATSPVREAVDIDDAITQFLAMGVNSLFSISTSQKENGSIYIFKSGVFKKRGDIKASNTAVFVMPEWKSCDIDYPKDMKKCTYHMRGISNLGVPNGQMEKRRLELVQS